MIYCSIKAGGEPPWLGTPGHRALAEMIFLCLSSLRWGISFSVVVSREISWVFFVKAVDDLLLNNH